MLRVVAEENDFFIVYKPVNVDFHADQGEPGFFLQAQNQLEQKLYPVHRLDKVTSGLVVLAKSREAAGGLGELFSQRRVQKLYLALASKKPKKKQGSIVGDMERARRGCWKLLNSKSNPAVTQFYSKSVGPGLRLYLLKPRTGKTHQLRVAMKSLGVAILGDQLYAGAAADRVYLHAYHLAFSYGERDYRFVNMPEEGELFLSVPFMQALSEFGDVEQLAWPVIGFADS